MVDSASEVKEEAQLSLTSPHSVFFGGWQWSHWWFDGRFASQSPRAVLNITFYEMMDWNSDEDYQFGHPSDKLEDLVVIFRPVETRKQWPQPQPDDLDRFQFFDLILPRITKLKITLVDLLAVPLPLLELQPAGNEPLSSVTPLMGDPWGRYRQLGPWKTLEEAIRLRLSNMALDKRGNHTMEEATRSVMDNIRFLTLDEYRREVGEHQFAIDTVPSKRSPDKMYP